MRNTLRADWLALSLIVASFGPYLSLSAGVRTEHALIYGLLPLAVLLLPLQRIGVLAFRPLAAILSLFLFVTGWTLLVTLSGTGAPLGRVISYFENYFQPIAIILVFAALVRPLAEADSLRLFRRLCQLLILMLLLNTGVAVASVFFDLSGVVRYFVGAPEDGGYTVWEAAAMMGRFSGIFNQPMESGLTYSLGLFAWAYLARTGSSPSLLAYLVLSLLMIGGALSVSKVFLLGGFPLFLLYWISLGRVRQLLTWRLLLVVGVAAAVVIRLVEHWIGLGFLLRLFLPGSSADPSLLSLYTAGRFGAEETPVKQLFARVWEEAPVRGLGFAAELTLDNGYAEFFVQGGMVALAGYLLILILMGWIGVAEYVRRREEGRFLLVCVIFIVGAGTGAPVLTINRFSTIFWTFLMVLCYTACARRAQAWRALPAVGRPGAPERSRLGYAAAA